jgi:hypothetical protein
MTPITPAQIKEIAEQIDCGFRCFIHKENGELIFLPDEQSYPGTEMEFWEEELEKVEENFTDYFVIDTLEPHESFTIMEDFVETLPDSESLKGRLIQALNQHKPFQQFKSVIDNSGAFRQQWFDFKERKLQEWVEEHIKQFSGLKSL